MDVVIIEDEPLAFKNLQAILKEIGNIRIVANFETIAESVEWFRNNNHPELVFMDIHLADGSAFEIFEQTTVRSPVIFTTAYDEYAIKAFKVNSIDYLLKPIDANAVRKALAKYNTLNPFQGFTGEFQKLISLYKQKAEYKTSFLIPDKADKLIPLPVDKIAFFYIDYGVTKAHTYEEHTFTIDHTLDELSEMLDPSVFFRVNRQYIVARNSIEDVDLWFNNRLSVNLKVKTPGRILISRARSSGFKNWFTGS